MYSFSPRNSTSFFLWPISENGNSIHQDLKKEAQVTCTILPFLSPLPFYDCEIYPSASEISELTSFHVHFLFTHEATIIFHLHYSNTLLWGSLSPGLAPFYLVWGTLQSWCCSEKQIWSHDSLVSNFSINPIALRRTAQFFGPFSPVQVHFASTCTTPSILLPRLNHFF